MVHEAIPGLSKALGNNVEVSTVWESKDHFLKDYTPFVKVIVKGRLTPVQWQIIQAQKGMLTLDSRCGICSCIDFTGQGKSDALPGSEGYMTYAFTEIQEAAERENMIQWVKDYQEKFNRVSGVSHTH